MKVILHADENLEFRQFDRPGLEIEPLEPHLHYSAIQMFATSLALCTFSILTSYGEQADASTDSLYMFVKWQFSGHPNRISHIEMDIHWPEIPASRLTAARRVASLCPLHMTLEKPPELITTVSN